MPHNVYWHDENEDIIRLDIEDNITWASWQEAMDRIIKMLHGSNKQVHVIINDHVGFPPGKSNPLMPVKQALTRMTSSPNMGLLIGISHGKLPTFVKSIVNLLLGTYFKSTQHFGGFADSVDEAMEVIAKHRQRSNPSQ